MAVCDPGTNVPANQGRNAPSAVVSADRRVGTSRRNPRGDATGGTGSHEMYDANGFEHYY